MGLGKLQPAAPGTGTASCTHSCFHSWIFHLGCGRQDPTQTRRPPSGPFFTSSTMPHAYLEGAIAEEHEQGLVSLHPLQEEQGWLPQVIYAGQVTSL